MLVIALCGVSLNSPEDVIFIQADGSADRKRQTGQETSEWKLRGGKNIRKKVEMRLILCFYFQNLSFSLFRGLSSGNIQ